jgi:hypothetical protein
MLVGQRARRGIGRVPRVRAALHRDADDRQRPRGEHEVQQPPDHPRLVRDGVGAEHRTPEEDGGDHVGDVLAGVHERMLERRLVQAGDVRQRHHRAQRDPPHDRVREPRQAQDAARRRAGGAQPERDG